MVANCTLAFSAYGARFSRHTVAVPALPSIAAQAGRSATFASAPIVYARFAERNAEVR